MYASRRWVEAVQHGPGLTRPRSQRSTATCLAHASLPCMTRLGSSFFDFNGTRIMFESNPDALAAIIYFWVDDIDAAHASLSEQGVSFTGTPHMIRKDDEGTFDNSGTEEWMAFF